MSDAKKNDADIASRKVTLLELDEMSRKGWEEASKRYQQQTKFQDDTLKGSD